MTVLERPPRRRPQAVALAALLATFSLCIPQSGGAGPAGPAAAGAGPPAATRLYIDMVSQDLTVVLFPDEHRIAADGNIVIDSSSDVAKLLLWLHPTLNVTRLERGGQPVAFRQSANMLDINLTPPLKAGDRATLDISYDGRLWVLEGGLRQDCVGWEGAYVKGSTLWFPCIYDSDWANYTLRLCCPANWTAVADGELVLEEHSPGWANYTWATDRPCMRPAFAAGNYSTLSRSSGGINITTFLFPQHSASAQRYLDEAVSIMELYSQLLGPYERQSLKIVETDHQTYLGYACSGLVMIQPKVFQDGGCNFNLLAHELGHQWFPFATGYCGWAQVWLWEGFPEYLSCLYEMDRYGTRGRLENDRNAYLAIHDDPNLISIRGSSWNTAYSYEIIYCKGAWVLHMLRGILGDASFIATLKDYVGTFRYGMGSAEEFILTAQRHSALKLDTFWQQWLNTSKNLDVSLPAARQYENSTAFWLELEPANLLNSSSWTDIGIEYTDSTRTTLRLGWDGSSGRLAFPVPAGVARVRLDPDGWLLDIDPTNQAAVPDRAGNLFDLQLLSASSPPDPVDGQELRLEAGVRNNGFYDADSVTVDFLLDGAPLAARNLSLSSKASATASVHWRATQGHHLLSVRVDPQDRFHEWDEANNDATVPLEVAPRPPLLDLRAGEITMRPPAAKEGESVRFCATIVNAGEAEVPDFNVSFLLDGAPAGSVRVQGLAPGAARAVTLDWRAVRGAHLLAVVADSPDQVNESLEDNNRAELAFFVGWRLGLELSFSPARPLTLETVRFTVNGSAEEYLFDLGDGTRLEWGPESNATHQYKDDGNYTVKVRGRAAGQLEEEVSTAIAICNRGPELDAWAEPPSPLSLTEVVFTSKALDLDGEVASVRWEFGDGTGAGEGRAVHNYTRPGRYNVSCTATDDDGARNSTSLELKVQNRPPVVESKGAPNVRVGETFGLAATASDPDGCVTRCQWDFGDGTGAEGLTVQHSYSREGRYQVRFAAQDDFGDWGNSTFWVAAEAFDVEASPPPSGAVASVSLAIIAGVAVAVWLIRRRKRQYREFFREPGD